MAFLNLPDDILFLVFDELDEMPLMRQHYYDCAWLLRTRLVCKRFDDFIMKAWLFSRIRTRKVVPDDEVILMDPQPTESTIAIATRLLLEQVNAGRFCNNAWIEAILQGARGAAVMRHSDTFEDIEDLQMRYRHALTSAAVTFGKMTNRTTCPRTELCRGTTQEVALLVASITGDVPWMKTLINSGTDVNCQDNFFGNPVCMAAFGGHVPAVKLLLDHGADGNCQKQHGPSSLDYAAVTGHVLVASFLISAGVAPTEESLGHAAAAGQAKVVALLLELDHISPNIEFAVSMAIERNHPNIVEELLKTADFDIGIFYFGDYGYAVAEAAYLGRESIMKLFLSHPRFDGTSDVAIESLDAAVRSGQDGVVRLLLDLPYIDPNYRDVRDDGNPIGGGITPLITAAACGDDNIVRLLMSHKDIDVNLMSTEAPGWEGWAPLGKAVINGHDDVVDTFLQCPDTDVNVQQAFGMTPLIQAAEYSPEMVALLLACDRIDPTVKDFHDRGPLFYAVREARLDIVEVLLRNPQIEVHVPDEYEVTPLMVAAAGDYADDDWCGPSRDEHDALIEMLLNYHEGEEPPKAHIRKALDLARDAGCYSILDVLQQKLDSNST